MISFLPRAPRNFRFFNQDFARYFSGASTTSITLSLVSGDDISALLKNVGLGFGMSVILRCLECIIRSLLNPSFHDHETPEESHRILSTPSPSPN